LPNTYTDSIFTDKELPAHMVADDLGQIKDELNGRWIERAYFMGIKRYAYINHESKIVTVFSGLKRDSISWEVVEAWVSIVKLSK